MLKNGTMTYVTGPSLWPSRVSWLTCKVWPGTHGGSRFIRPGWITKPECQKVPHFVSLRFYMNSYYRQKFTDDAKVRITLNKMHVRFRIQIHVSRLKQWSRTSETALGRGTRETCTWVPVQDRRASCLRGGSVGEPESVAAAAAPGPLALPRSTAWGSRPALHRPPLWSVQLS